MIKKISIIGAGYVGSSIAYSLMLIEAAEEIALVDVNPVAVNAEVADIRPGFYPLSVRRKSIGEAMPMRRTATSLSSRRASAANRTKAVWI